MHFAIHFSDLHPPSFLVSFFTYSISAFSECLAYEDIMNPGAGRVEDGEITLVAFFISPFFNLFRLTRFLASSLYSSVHSRLSISSITCAGQGPTR